MAARKKVWDLGAEGGPVEIEMFSVDADEAVANDPERYSFNPPDGTVQAEIAEREMAANAERVSLAAEEERKVREADQAAMKKRKEIEDAAAEERKKKAQDEKEKAAENPSEQGRLQQVEAERAQKEARARNERAVAELKLGQTAGVAPVTTAMPGPVPNRADQQLENQVPSPEPVAPKVK